MHLRTEYCLAETTYIHPEPDHSSERRTMTTHEDDDDGVLQWAVFTIFVVGKKRAIGDNWSKIISQIWGDTIQVSSRPPPPNANS